jgi:hypothetical protein
MTPGRKFQNNRYRYKSLCLALDALVIGFRNQPSRGAARPMHAMMSVIICLVRRAATGACFRARKTLSNHCALELVGRFRRGCSWIAWQGPGDGHDGGGSPKTTPIAISLRAMATRTGDSAMAPPGRSRRSRRRLRRADRCADRSACGRDWRPDCRDSATRYAV